MEGRWIRRSTSDAVVVFVHGVLSDGEECWKHENGTFWPELVAKEGSLSTVGVYLFKYNTGIFSGTYSLGDVVDSMRSHLRLDRVLLCKKIIFVCHSMGGIVARRFLVKNQLELVREEKEIGLFLLASPSLGSEYANWLKHLARLVQHSQADALRFSETNVWLRDLDRDFFNLKESNNLKISGKELIEDKFIVLKNIMRRQVVEPFSAGRYFGDSIKIPNSDHSSIIRIQDSSALQHRLLLEFITNIIGQEGDDTRSHKVNFNGPIEADAISCQLFVQAIASGVDTVEIEWPESTKGLYHQLQKLSLEVEDHLSQESVFYGCPEEALMQFTSGSKQALDYVEKIIDRAATRVIPLVKGMTPYWPITWDSVLSRALQNYITLCNIEMIYRITSLFRIECLFEEYFPAELEYWYEMNDSSFIYKNVFSISDEIVHAKIYEISGQEIETRGMRGAYFWGPKNDVLASSRRKEEEPVTGTWFDKYLIPQNELRLLEDESNQLFRYDEKIRTQKVIDQNGTEIF